MNFYFITALLALLASCADIEVAATNECSPMDAPEAVPHSEIFCNEEQCVVVCEDDYLGWDVLECQDGTYQPISRTFICERASGRLSDDTIQDEVNVVKELVKIQTHRTVQIVKTVLTRYNDYKTDKLAVAVENALHDKNRRNLGLWETLTDAIGDAAQDVKEFVQPIHDVGTSLIWECMDEDAHGWPYNTGTAGYCHCGGNWGVMGIDSPLAMVKCSWNCHWGPCHTCLVKADYRNRCFGGHGRDANKCREWNAHCPGKSDSWTRPPNGGGPLLG